MYQLFIVHTQWIEVNKRSTQVYQSDKSTKVTNSTLLKQTHQMEYRSLVRLDRVLCPSPHRTQLVFTAPIHTITNNHIDHSPQHLQIQLMHPSLHTVVAIATLYTPSTWMQTHTTPLSETPTYATVSTAHSPAQSLATPTPTTHCACMHMSRLHHGLTPTQ